MTDTFNGLRAHAAHMLADFLSESSQGADIEACVRAGGRLHLAIDFPRTHFDEWRVSIQLIEPDGNRHLLADVAQLNCTQ